MKNQLPIWVNVINIIESSINSAKDSVKLMLSKLNNKESDKDKNSDYVLAGTIIEDVCAVMMSQQQQIEALRQTMMNVMTYLKQHGNDQVTTDSLGNSLNGANVVSYNPQTGFHIVVSHGDWKDFWIGYRKDD